MNASTLLRTGGWVLPGLVAVAVISRSFALPDSMPSTLHSSFPLQAEAHPLLDATHHHGEWVSIAAGGRTVLAAVTYPDRPDPAPVVVVSPASADRMEWARAVADQLTDEGYIAVVPDALAADAVATEAALKQLASHPAANGRTARVVLGTDLRISTDSSSARYDVTKASWSGAVGFLQTVTGNDPSRVVPMPKHSMHGADVESQDEHVMHGSMNHVPAALTDGTSNRAVAGVMGAAAPAPGVPPVVRGYPRSKLDDLPAGLFTAKTTMLRSTLKFEWVDIPTPGAYNGRMHTRITYPDGTAPAGIVVVMQHGPGMDDWMRALGDQLSKQGFIALVPDLHTGMGPNGGNYDSFAGPEDVFVANAKFTPAMSLAAYEAVRQYGLKLPRSNGKSAVFGFCMGGSNAWNLAMNAPDLNAAVVYYGAANGEEAALSKINAPVIGFYGEDDARVTATVEKTSQAMKKLGKTFEPHVYAHATHGFLEFQDLGGNPNATRDSWTRAIAFLQQYLR